MLESELRNCSNSQLHSPLSTPESASSRQFILEHSSSLLILSIIEFSKGLWQQKVVRMRRRIGPVEKNVDEKHWITGIVSGETERITQSAKQNWTNCIIAA